MKTKETRERRFDVHIPTPDGEGIDHVVPISITEEWDEEIREWFVTPASEELVEKTKARHMGLLLPEELKALRLRLGLSQRETGALLQIGEKSWTRWETGKQRPSRSINLLLRALDDGLLTVDYLRETCRSSTADWSKVIYHDFCEPVSMDRLAPANHNQQASKNSEPLLSVG